MATYFNRLQDPTVVGMVQISYIIVGTMLASLVPAEYAKQFDNPLVKGVALTLVAMCISKDVSTALAVAATFLIMNYIIMKNADSVIVQGFAVQDSM